MNKKTALILGVSKVNPQYYAGWEGKLKQPEQDALSFKMIADEYGFSSTMMLTEEVTRDNVILSIRNTSSIIDANDLFLIYYSGHGGQIPAAEDDDEPDGLSETWCLYDRCLIDKELSVLWGEFKKGAKIVFISDSCHSETVAIGNKKPWISFFKPENYIIRKFIPKREPSSAIETAYLKDKDFYESINQQLSQNPRKEILAEVMTLAGCKDSQSSYALVGAKYSVFTDCIHESLKYFKDRGEKATYVQLMDHLQMYIPQKLYNKQTPVISFHNNNQAIKNDTIFGS